MVQLWIYQHYKGKKYEVIWVAKHSENLEELIVYKALYEDEYWVFGQLWIRPLDMFFESIVINWEKIARFSYIGE